MGAIESHWAGASEHKGSERQAIRGPQLAHRAAIIRNPDVDAVIGNPRWVLSWIGPHAVNAKYSAIAGTHPYDRAFVVFVRDPDIRAVKTKSGRVRLSVIAPQNRAIARLFFRNGPCRNVPDP